MKKSIIVLSLFTALALTSCGTETTTTESSIQPSSAETTERTVTDATAEETTEHATAPQNEVGYEGMTELSAGKLNDGQYNISVDSSSTMFKIAECILNINDGKMTAQVIINSKSYDALFMGSEEEAESADESSLITYTENESGQSVFEVPVEALDKEIECAALSAKKGEWYGRTLVFRADSLPEEAFKEKRYKTAEELGFENGDYTVEVNLEGGSGKASIASPAKLTIKEGTAYAVLVWSSDKYDKMEINGETLTPEIVDGHSVFEIKVTGFDYKLPISAETTAMSEPHMIDYTLYFDSATIKECK